MIMSINLIKKDELNLEDLTIFLTVTTTYTLSGSETTIIPSTTTILTMITEYTRNKVTSLNSHSSYSSTSTQAKSSAENSSTTESHTSETGNSSSNSSSSVASSTFSSSLPTLTTNKSVDNLLGSSGSIKLGLAIGVPVSVVSILIIITLAFIYVKKSKKKPSKMVSYNNEFFKVNNSNQNYDSSSSVYSGSTKENPVINKTSDNEEILKQSDKRYDIRNYLKDRFSKVINVKDLESAEFDSPKIKSPILKKFNLEKPKVTNNYNESISSWLRPKNTNSFISKIEPQFLPISFKDLKKDIKSEKVKDLPQLPEHDLQPRFKVPEKAEYEKEQDYGAAIKVIRDYNKRRDDEIDVTAGDKIIILKTHSDGWCKVKALLDEEKVGYIPSMCL